jgi:hypothetical protein
MGFRMPSTSSRSDARDEAASWTVPSRRYRSDPRPALDAAFLMAAGHPTLLERLRACSTRWSERASEDGVDATTAAVVMHATDGFWLADALGLHGADRGGAGEGSSRSA